MTRRWMRFLGLVLWLGGIVSEVLAQHGGTQPGGAQSTNPSTGAPSSQASGSGVSLPGLFYVNAEWGTLGLPPANKKRTVLCYKLQYTNSSSQPFVLEPIPIISKADPRPSLA